jgi:hypothetical protein
VATWGHTVQSNGEKIVGTAARMKTDLEREVERLDDQLRALKTTVPLRDEATSYL